MTIDSVARLILQDLNFFLHIAYVKYPIYSHLTNSEGFIKMSLVIGF